MAPRRRRLVRLLVAITVTILLVAGALTYSPLFRIRHVRVEGNVTLTSADIRSLAGIDPSANVAHADLATIAGRLTANPWIAAAEVHRALPDTLVLVVSERRPIGVITAMGATSILATDGTALPVADGVGADLPSVRADLGALGDAQRKAAAALLTALDSTVLRDVTEIVVGQDGGMTLTLKSGATVDAGTAGDEAVKAQALHAVLRWASNGGLRLTSIDISAPSAPSATLADGSTLTP